MLTLNTIRKHPGATTARKRLGRGSGSGLGKTAGKGHKGQLARSGGTSRPGFEGGQMPLYRRIPKRGFKNPGRRSVAIINLGEMDKLNPKDFPLISLESLTGAKVIKGRYDRLTILGTGEVKQAFKVKAHRISASAQEKIQKAGGQCEVLPIPGPQPRELKKNKRKPAASVTK